MQIKKHLCVSSKFILILQTAIYNISSYNALIIKYLCFYAAVDLLINNYNLTNKKKKNVHFCRLYFCCENSAILINIETNIGFSVLSI